MLRHHQDRLTFLVFGKMAARIIDETFRVNQPNTLTCLFLGHAIQSEKAHQLHCNTDPSRTRSKEKDAMISEGPA